VNADGNDCDEEARGIDESEKQARGVEAEMEHKYTC
jgi:hypothetical protein